MQKLFDIGQFTFAGQCAHLSDVEAFQQLTAAAQAKKWQVYAKPPFGAAMQTLAYLGRYVHRIAISNHRILDIAGGQVRFAYRDYQDGGRQKEMVLPAVEFMRRFLQHVLPKRFVRVRHYGLLAPRYRRQKLTRCRALLGFWREDVTMPASRAEILTAMWAHDPQQCPLCGVGKMRSYAELKAQPTRRKWQLAIQ